MKPLELLNSIYETFGASHPRISLAVVTLLGAILFAGVWIFAARQYERSLVRTPPAQAAPSTGSATTSGAESPAITGSGNAVTYGQPPDSNQPQPKKKD